jgi:hypothetical protein
VGEGVRGSSPLQTQACLVVVLVCRLSILIPSSPRPLLPSASHNVKQGVCGGVGGQGVEAEHSSIAGRCTVCRSEQVCGV